MTRVAVCAAALATAGVVLAGCGGSDGTETPKTAAPVQIAPFTYDPSQPLATHDSGRINSKYPIAIRDISYASGGRRVSAFLAVPPTGGRRAAVIYVHGSG